MSCNGSNFNVVYEPVTDLMVRWFVAPQGFEAEPSEHVIGDEPGIGESIIGGNKPS